MTLKPLPWRRPLSPALVGTLAVLALLPRVSRTHTLLLAAGTLATAALPLAVTVSTGQMIVALPDAVSAGLDSPAGRNLIGILVLVGALILLARALGPLQSALAVTFAREVDRHLQ